MDKAVLIFVAFLAAALFEESSGQVNVGNCNLTVFTGGGQKCQREMIMELKSNLNANCSFEFEKESVCVSNHVTDCVKDNGLLNAVKGDISQLLQVLLYHCGNLTYNVKQINPLVLKTVDCNADELDKILTCWDDFRSSFQANRSDPSLCRKYAEAKQNCANIARQACRGICEYIPKDEYNPFCSNHTDPPATSELFDCILSLDCPLKVVFDEAKKCEQIGFKDFAGGPKDCSDELKKNKDCLRNNLMSKCSSISKKAQVFEDVVKGIEANLMIKRFFCGQVSLNKESLHRSVKPLVNCKPEFFTAAEKCAGPFRQTYDEASTKKSQKVCNAFSDVKKCLNKEHQQYCEFNEETKKAAEYGDENPFCEGGKDPQKGGAGSASAGALAFLLFIYSIAMLFV